MVRVLTGCLSTLLVVHLRVAPRACIHAKARPGGPKAKQSLGQNFLSDPALAQGIVDGLVDAETQLSPASLDGGHRVIELGPGQGALTGRLLASYPRMAAVEIDQRMTAVLRETLPGLDDLREQDMMELDLSELAAEKGGRLSVVSNTPFYLTSPLLFKILGSLDSVERAVLTMQLEVGDKVLSKHGCKDYGPLSVMLQLFASPHRLFDIPPEAFRPAPKCHVSVLRFHPTDVPLGSSSPLSPAQRAQLLALVKLTFEQRRKMLRHTLKKLLPDAVTPPPAELLALRPEQLEPAQFVELAAMLFGDDTDGGGEVLLARSHASASWSAHKAGWFAKSSGAAKAKAGHGRDREPV